MTKDERGIVEDIIISLENHKRSIPMGEELKRPEYDLYTMRIDTLKFMFAEIDNIYGYHGYLELIEDIKKERDRLKSELAECKKVCLYNHIDRDIALHQSREIDNLKIEVEHWKKNHKDMMERNAVLRQRPDLDVNRLPVVIGLQKEIERLKEEIHDKGDCNDCSGGQG